jgi:hypothetical protein
MPPKSKTKTKKTAKKSDKKVIKKAWDERVHYPQLQQGFMLERLKQLDGSSYDNGFHDGRVHGRESVSREVNPKILSSLPVGVNWLHRDNDTNVYIPTTMDRVHERYHMAEGGGLLLHKQMNNLQSRKVFTKAMTNKTFQDGLNLVNLQRHNQVSPYKLTTRDGPYINVSKIQNRFSSYPDNSVNLLDSMVAAPLTSQQFDAYMRNTNPV